MTAVRITGPGFVIDVPIHNGKAKHHPTVPYMNGWSVKDVDRYATNRRWSVSFI